MKAMIFDIQRNSFVDGPGIRTTVFFKGCNLRCKWCHNPESQKLQKEIMFYKNKCTGCGRCKDLTVENENFVCFNDAKEICGKEYAVDEVLKEVLKDKSFYENSDGGVTLSGGECLIQADFCAELLKRLKDEGINTAVDTCGFVPRSAIDKVLSYTDVFLYDIKAIVEDVHIKCTGQSNKIICENLKYIDSCGKQTEIRIPYVPTYNDDQIEKIGEFLSKLNNVVKVRILPYHNYAGSKYKSLDMENTLPEILPTDEEIESAKDLIRAKGLVVCD